MLSALGAVQAQEGGSYAALVTFGGYSVAVFLLAWFSHKLLSRRKFVNEYYLGSRGLGVMALTLSYGATSASAGSFVGFPSLVYSHGWVVGFWISGYMIVPLVGMALFGKRINQVARRAEAITVPDLLRGRFGSRAVGLLATGLIIFLLSFYLVPQFKTAGLILDKLFLDVPFYDSVKESLGALIEKVPLIPDDTEVGYLLCLGIFAVLVIAYTSFGGFRAVVWTDVVQGFVMVFGVVFMLVMALSMVGGLTRSTEKLAEMTPPRLGEMAFASAAPVGEKVVVPALTWVDVGEGEEPRLLRTNQEAVVEKGAKESEPVKVVEITTPFQIEEVRSGPGFVDGKAPALPGGLVARISGDGMRDYTYGKDQKGVYVSAPGPHAGNLVGFMPLGLAISFFFLWPLGMSGQPGNMVRLMAFDTSRTFKRSLFLLALYYAMIYFPLVIIFVCARLIVPGMESASDRIMPEMAFSLAQAAEMPWLAGLLVAAPFAAAMSTVDSFMLMISSSVVRDVYQQNINPKASEKTIKRLGFGVTILVGLVVAIGAIKPPEFLQYLIVFASSGLAVAFLAPVSLALYWPRFNTPGVLASMTGGFAVFISLYVAGFILYKKSSPVLILGLDPLIWGFVVSLVLGVLVAKLTPPPPGYLVRKFFTR